MESHKDLVKYAPCFICTCYTGGRYLNISIAPVSEHACNDEARTRRWGISLIFVQAVVRLSIAFVSYLKHVECWPPCRTCSYTLPHVLSV